jgi:NitT/TauT family transport system substrate-binding protein
MYSAPEALTIFAEIAGVPPEVARKMPGLFPRSALAPDRIVGLDAIMAEAVATKFMSAPLRQEQIAELVRTPEPPK